ncbi:3-keto-5-aminohexanoate cleavage protein [Mesorhizobium sp. ArgA1]
MIVQACINGARSRDFHPLLPLTVEDIARDAAASVAAGAAELHIHPRSPDGRESLLAVDETIDAVRRACPGTLVGVSTGAWIEGDEDRTREAIRHWDKDLLPDYASVNLAENDAPAVMQLLRQRGVGIEVGLATVADAERYVCLEGCKQVLRVLIELDFEQDFRAAREIGEGILRTLGHANVQRPILLHGFDATVWPFVELARKRCFSTRIGLEDGKLLPDGAVARDNAALVAKVVEIFRGGHDLERSAA